MNGYNLTRCWYNFKFDNSKKVRHIHSDMYFYIIDLWNRLGQKNDFGLPTTVTMEALGIGSYNTYKKCLNDLVDFGFINIVSESKNQHQSKVVALSKFDKATDKALDKATIKATDKATDSINKQYNNETSKQRNNIDFDIFWNLYDKKINTKWCKVKWNKLDFETQQKIIDFIPSFLKSITDKKFQPHPKTFLNAERWNDEIEVTKKEIPPFEFDFKKHGGDLNLFNKLKLEHERKYS